MVSKLYGEKHTKVFTKDISIRQHFNGRVRGVVWDWILIVAGLKMRLKTVIKVMDI